MVLFRRDSPEDTPLLTPNNLFSTQPNANAPIPVHPRPEPIRCSKYPFVPFGCMLNLLFCSSDPVDHIADRTARRLLLVGSRHSQDVYRDTSSYTAPSAGVPLSSTRT